MAERRCIGLALSGGVVRGPAHLGVLSVLEEARIPIDIVAGVSAGSLAGFGYCAGIDLTLYTQIAFQMRWADISQPVFPRKGFLSFEKMDEWLVAILGDLHFSDLEKPFVVVATDLQTGEPVVLDSGRVAPVVRASCSPPGFVTPTRIAGRVLGDGGVSNNLPSRVLRRYGAEFVIGVDLFRPSFERGFGPVGMWAGAVENLVRRSGGGLEDVDCLISPDLAGMSYFHFSQAKSIFNRGRQAALAALPGLRAALRT